MTQGAPTPPSSPTTRLTSASHISARATYVPVDESGLDLSPASGHSRHDVLGHGRNPLVGGVVGLAWWAKGRRNGSLLLTQDADIWSLALEQGADPAFDSRPLWTPDDDRVVFRSDREPPTGLF